jgi:hypothetical protein
MLVMQSRNQILWGLAGFIGEPGSANSESARTAYETPDGKAADNHAIEVDDEVNEEY